MVDSVEQASNNNPSPQPPRNRHSIVKRLLRPTKKKAIGLTAIASMLGLSYYTAQWWAKKNLPGILETEAAKLLNRPVDVGEIESISLRGVKIGKSVIPPTATERDKLEIAGIDVGFNLLPVIFKRTLPVEVTLVKPQIFVDQSADGEWLKLELPESEGEGKLPIDLDITANIEDARVTAVPYNYTPIEVTAKGEGRYSTADNQLVAYDLDAEINRAQATLKGKTVLKTGKTDTKVLVKDLALDDVVSLIPNLPLSLDTGVLNADLNLDIPSWEEITSANVEGTVNLQQVKGEVENLPQGVRQNVKAKSRLSFNGRNAEVNTTEATIGDVTAQVKGAVDLDTGYDLNVAVLPVSLQSLQQTFAIELPVTVTGEVISEIDISGEIEKPVVKGRFASTEDIKVDKTVFKTINGYFSADLDKVVLKNLSIIPQAGGAITANGLIETDIAQSLENQKEIDLTQIPLSVTFEANLPTQAIAKPYYELPSEVKVGNLIAEGNLGGTIQNLKGLVQWQLAEGSIATTANNTEAISGKGEILYLKDSVLLRDTVLNVGEGEASVTANANLQAQTWQGAINTADIYLTPFISQYEINGLDLTRPITLANTDIALSGTLDNVALESIQGKANVALDLDGGAVTLNSRFAEGRVDTTADTGNLSIHRFVTNLKIPVTTQVSSLFFTSEIKPLLNIVETRDFSTIDSTVTANVRVADGWLVTKGSLSNNRWEADIQGSDINTNKVVNAYAPDVDLAYALQPISTQANLTGNLAPLQDEVVNFPITINNSALQMGEQSVTSKGNVTITNLFEQPDIPLLDLAVTSNLNFDRLPIEEFVAKVTENNALLAERVNLKGQSYFKGNFRGKNLISDSANLENYQLTGSLSLNNVAFNDIVFDRSLSGKVNVQPASIIKVDLRGKEDVIAASAQPCNANRCSLPYIPNSLEFRQGEGTTQPVIATGNRNGDVFHLEIDNFPLALLNLAPGKTVGIEGALSGKVTGDINANLYNFTTDGNVLVEKPAVGYIEAKKFAADFAYNPQQNMALVNTASFNLGNSEYNFNAQLNTSTGAIDGKLNIPQAYVQDIFTALGWYSVEDALMLFQKPEYIAARKITPKSVTTEISTEQTIAQKLVLLRKIENQIQEIAQQRKISTIPTELDIKGKYAGEISLGGTLNTPEVAFNIAGNNWQWQPQPEYLDIIPKLGLIKEAGQSIPIPQLLAVGKLEGDTVNLQQAKIEIIDTIFSATGKLSPTTQDASYKVENLTVDTIGRFIDIPVDIAGRIDTEGTIVGTLQQPQITGNLSVTESAFNGTALPTTIAGKYNYSNQQLDFNTTEPSSIQIAATIPYPIQRQTNDTLTTSAKITKEAFPLLDAFTGGNLAWIDGDGNADIQATAKLDLNREGNPLYNLDATGVVNLDSAQLNLKTPFFSAPILATGKINLKNLIVDVETLDATFAEKDVTIVGALPILEPVANLENPLTIDIPEGEINIEKLYKGGVTGNIIVTSAALTPTIGGEVSLIDGRVSIPQVENEETYTLNINNPSDGTNTGNNFQNESSAIVATLDNFLIKLEEFKLEQTPLYEFGVRGELTLNGTTDTPENIEPEGTIYVTQGDVDWLSSNFTLVRDRENRISFYPDKGVFNPYVDVQMKTEVSDLNNVRQLATNSNEVPDNITQSSRAEVINVFLGVNGEVADIIPDFAQNTSNGCNLSPNNVPPTNDLTYSQTELDSLAECVNLAAFSTGNAKQLLDNQAVNLTSIPNRRQGEIVNLLGNQFLGFAEQIQNSNQDELISLGVTHFVIAPIQRRLFYRVEDFVVANGKKIGLDYLRVYPYVEGIYELSDRSSIRGTYDYVFNEVQLQYQLNF